MHCVGEFRRFHGIIHSAGFVAARQFESHCPGDGNLKLIAEMQYQWTGHFRSSVSGKSLLQFAERLDAEIGVAVLYQLKHSLPILTCHNQPFYTSVFEFPACFHGILHTVSEISNMHQVNHIFIVWPDQCEWKYPQLQRQFFFHSVCAKYKFSGVDSLRCILWNSDSDHEISGGVRL
ncbi:MAG TPA: hypothetical protein DE060_07005 [Lentisphaeria bacterium]|nr:hypothetical protein [Lentisphaeria bacterium]HCG48939.1 hypothetical protein [Lentisphaeria bacterium]